MDAPREKVHVSPGYYCDAQVKVQGVERPQLQFKPLVQRRSYTIVGLDPGTTTGIAALSLSGDLIDVISAREMSSSDVIEWIAARGRPLLVATDVFPTPGAVEKVKRSFNAVLYSPGADVPAEEKIALAREFGYKNDHERDSLAAAISAYKKYKNKFLQVDKKVPPEIDPDEVKALVVKGYSIENAIAELTAQPIPEAKPAPPTEASTTPDIAALRGQNQQLAEQIKTLRAYMDELNAELTERNESIGRLRDKMDRMRDKAAREIKRDQEIKIRDKEIDRLRALLRSERKYIRKLKQDRNKEKKVEKIEEIKGYQRLKLLETFSKEAIIAASERWGIEKGDVIHLEDASGGGPNTADLLIEREIKAVITDSDMAPEVREYFYEKGIPVFSSKEVQIHMVNGVAFIKPEDVEVALAAWQDLMKLRQAERKADWLEGMLRDYRVERRKEERKKLKQP